MGRMLFIFVLLIVLGAWVSVFFSGSWFGVALPETLNEIGDSFGAVNALFAGLGFAGIVYSLYLQRSEIDKAAGQIDAQSDAILKLTAALTKQAELISKSLDVQGRQVEEMTRLVAAYERQLEPIKVQAEAAVKAIELSERHNSEEQWSRSREELRRLQPSVRERLAGHAFEKNQDAKVAQDLLGDEYLSLLGRLLDTGPEEDAKEVRGRFHAILTDDERVALLYACFEKFPQNLFSGLARKLAANQLLGTVKQDDHGTRALNFYKAASSDS